MDFDFIPPPQAHYSPVARIAELQRALDASQARARGLERRLTQQRAAAIPVVLAAAQLCAVAPTWPLLNPLRAALAAWERMGEVDNA